MKKNIVAASLIIAAILLNSCTQVTALDRSMEYPTLYKQVPQNQRKHVLAGEIRNGMTENTVFLAWGAPNTPKVTGQNGDKDFVKWNYSRQIPIVNHNYAPRNYIDAHGITRDYNGYANNNTSYISEIYASVTFTDGKVSSWEK